MKKKLHVLYIPKWYPTRVNKLLGIFTKHHALASALHHKVSVLYVCSDNSISKKEELEIREHEGVQEILVYYKPHTLRLVNFIRKLISYKNGLKCISNYDLIHAHVFIFPVFLAYVLSFFKKVPFVISEHWTGYRKGFFKKNNFFLKKISFFLARKASFIMPVSDFLKEDMIKCGFKGNYVVVGNVVSFLLKKIPKEEKFTFLYAGDIVEENKNISGIIKAFNNLVELGLKNIRLSIIGDGIDMDKIRALALNLTAKKHINFFGNRSHDFTMNKLKQAHVLVLNSRFETFSVICAEAMFSSIPVITTRCGGPESFVSKKGSILINVNDDKDLTNAMLTIKDNYNNFIKNDIDMKKSVELFLGKKIGQKFNKIYRDALITF